MDGYELIRTSCYYTYNLKIVIKSKKCPYFLLVKPRRNLGLESHRYDLW